MKSKINVPSTVKTAFSNKYPDASKVRDAIHGVSIQIRKGNYKGSRIIEAGKVTDAKGRLTYEAEVNRKDIIFDEKGNFVKNGE